MVEELINRMFKARNAAHIRHWKTDSYSEHKALGHYYDDLIDKDKPIPEEFVHDVMWSLMVELPTNRFYTSNAALLAPIFATGILNWRGANDMEKRGCKEELYISHATRYSINDLALMVMMLLGGPEHAAKYARDARLSFQRDTITHYLREQGYE